MKSLAAEQIKVARILLNLGHSYLQSTSLENSEDEEEEGEENEEQKEEEEEEDEKYDGEYNEEMEIETDKQFNVQKNNVEEFTDEKLKLTINKQYNIKEEIEEQFYRGIPGKVNRELQLVLDKSYDESLQQEFEKQRKLFIEENTLNTFIKMNHDKLFKNFTITNYRVIPKDIQSKLYEYNKNVLCNFEQIKQQMFNGDEVIELDFKMPIQLKNLQELNQTIHKELNKKQQITKKNIERGLSIEMEIKSELQQQLDRKLKKIVEGNTSLDIGVDVQINKKFLQEFDNKEQKKRKQQCKQDEIIKYNINLQHNFENKIKNKSNKNIDFNEEIINKIQLILNKELQDNSKCEQELNTKIEEKLEDLQIENNRKVLDNTYKKKQVEEHIFDRDIHFDNYEIQPKLDNEIKNKLIEESNIEEGLHLKCNEKVLNNLHKEEPRKKSFIILHNRHKLFNIKDEQVLCNKIQDKFQGISQPPVNSIQFVFDGESLIELDKIKQIIKKHKTEFDNKSFKTKIQDNEQVIKNKINIKPTKEVDRGFQLESFENTQVQFLYNVDKDLQKTFHKETEVICDSDIEFRSQLKTHKIIHDQLVDIFNIEIQRGINKVVHDIVERKRKINDGIQQFSNIEKKEELVKYIQQEIEELEREIEELNQDQDEELEREIIEKINKIYSLKPKFLENLTFLLYQDTIPLNKRVEKLYDLYFPNVCNEHKQFNLEIQTEFEKKLQPMFNEEFSYQFNTNYSIDMNSITQQELKNEIQEVYDSRIQNDIDKDKVKDTQLKFFDEIKEVERKMEIDSNKETQINVDEQEHQLFETKIQVYVDECEQTQRLLKTNLQEKIEELLNKKVIFQYFDIVIEFNKEMDKKTQQAVIKKALVEYDEKILKDYINDTEKNIDQNRKISDKRDLQLKLNNINQKIKNKIEYYDDITLQQKFEGDCYKKLNETKKVIVDDINLEFCKLHEILQGKIEKNNELQPEVEEKKKVENEIQIKVKEEVQYLNKELIKEINNKACFELEFYRKTLKIEEEFINEHKNDLIKNNEQCCIDLDRDIFERKLVDKPEKVNEFGAETKYNFKQKRPELENDIHLKEFQDLFKELKKESVVIIDDDFEDKIQEEFKEEIQKNCLNIDKMKIEVQKEYETKIKDKSDIEMEEEFEVKNGKESEVDIEEQSDVEIEDFYDKIHDFPRESQENEYDDSDIEFKYQNKYDVEINKVDEELEDINEIIAEQFEVNSTSSEDSFILINEESSPIEEYNYTKEEFSSMEELSSVEEELSSAEELGGIEKEFSSLEEPNDVKEFSYTEEPNDIEEFSSTDEEYSSTDVEYNSMDEDYSSTDDNFSYTLEKEKCNTEIQQQLNKNNQEKHNTNVQMYEGDKQEITDTEVQQELNIDAQQYNVLYQKCKQSPVKFKGQNLQMFDDLLHTEIENIQDLDEIPLELKIQQEQLEEKLHKQFKQFQKEFYKNLKLEYDKEQLLKVNKSFNPKLLHIFGKQQQLFYELKDEFHEIKQEYKDFVQQKIFEELQQEVDENLLFEIDKFPEDVNSKLNQKFNEDIHKEFVKLLRDCSELEPEFKYNVPLEFEEEELNQLSKQKPLNIFEKLKFVHKQKLCDFVDSEQWPENCLYPSSLLDSLFEKPFEIKLNVLIITLYSIDIGYSIKLSMDENELPIEIFFNYNEDSILEYVEKEQLPPHLLDLLDRAEPKLFYYGCVIAEIHNKKDGILNDLYRILLRPSNMSIQSDLTQLLAENNNIDWSYKKRLKLESMLLLISNPVMCMDSSPIAGLTINLQHQILSCRSINLNPLKKKYTPSKLKPLEINLIDDLNILHTSDLSNKLQGTLSKLIDSNDNTIHHVTWKFDFRIKSFKFISLFVLVIKETLEYSMLLSINPIVEFVMMIRFKINLETNLLKTYINVIQEILKQKIKSDISVVQKYKSVDILSSRSITSIPKLFSDSIFEPNSTDINKLINNLFENKLEYLCDKIEFELKTNTSLDLSINLPDEMQNNNTKEISRVIKVNHNIKKNFNLFRTNISSQKTDLEIPSKNIKENEMHNVKLENKLFFDTSKFSSIKPIIVSSLLKSPTTLMNICLDHDTGLPSKEKPIINDEKLYDMESTISVTLADSLDNKKNSNTKSTLLSTPNTNTEILTLASSNLIIQTRSILNPKSSVSSLETTPLMSNSNNVILSLSNHTDELPLVSNSLFVTDTSSVTNSVATISPISTSVSKMSLALSHKKTLNVDCKLVSTNLISPTDRNKLQKLKNYSIGLSKFKHLKYLNKKGDSAINVLENVNPPILCEYNAWKTSCGTLFTNSLLPQSTETISVMKHVHDNGICLKGSKIVVNKAIPQIISFTQKTSTVDQISTTDLQLDRRKKTQIFDNVLNSVIVKPSDFQVTLPNVIVPLKPLTLSQSNSHDQNNEPKIISSDDSFKNHQLLKHMKSYFINKMSSKNNLINDDAFQGIKNNTTSSNIDGYIRVKRKRTTS